MAASSCRLRIECLTDASARVCQTTMACQLGAALSTASQVSQLHCGGRVVE